MTRVPTLKVADLIDVLEVGDVVRGHVFTCKVCGELCLGRKDAVYCSNKCWMRAYRSKS